MYPVSTTGTGRSSRLLQALKQLVHWSVDRAGRPEHRMLRRERAFQLISLMRSAAMRGIEVLVPSHRDRIRLRKHCISELSTAEASETGRAPSAPVLGTVPAPRLGGPRIGVLIPGFLAGLGGAEKVAGQVAGALSRGGAKVDLICRPVKGGVDHPYQWDQSVNIVALQEHEPESVRALCEHGYDLMVAFGMAGFYRRIPWVATSIGVPFVIQECTNPQSMVARLRMNHFLDSEHSAHWLRQAVLAHAAAVRFTVPAYAETVMGSIRPRTYAFYNAFTPPSTVGRSPAQPKIICVGALKNRNKNGLVAAEAFARFAQQRPGWRLVFYGQNNYQEALARLSRGNPAAEIRDEGVERDIGRIYGDAYALVIPSYSEGLPNVVVEALSYGVPCIGFSDCPGVKDLIKDGETGLLINRKDGFAIDKALARLSDPGLRAELSANCLRFAADWLGRDQWETNWLTLVSDALSRRNDGSRSAGQTPDPRWSQLLSTYPVWD